MWWPFPAGCPMRPVVDKPEQDMRSLLSIQRGSVRFSRAWSVLATVLGMVGGTATALADAPSPLAPPAPVDARSMGVGRFVDDAAGNDLDGAQRICPVQRTDQR